MTDRFEPRLSEYLDGELERDEATLVEAHLDDCAACREVLAGLERVSTAASALPARTPPRDLWTGIAARIEELDGASAPVLLTEGESGPTKRRLPRDRLTWPQLAAAAVALMVLSSTLAWQLAPRSPSPDPGVAVERSPGVTLASDRATDTPSDDRRAAIARMEAALLSDEAALSPQLREHVRRALQKIDQAIVEAERALASAPGDVFVRQHLDAKLDQKAEFLRRTSRLIST